MVQEPRGLILAIDTATRRLSVALMDGDACVGRYDDDEKRLHAEGLLPAIEGLLRTAAVSVEELLAFAVSIGPGSFTGLRIGLATVKGLTFGGTQPVVPVPTLLGLAVAADAPGVRGAVLDARRGEAYAAWLPRGAAALAGEGVYTPESLAAVLPPGATIAVGEDADAFAKSLSGRVEVSLVQPVPTCAERIGKLARPLLAGGVGGPGADLVPHYVRRAEAEVRRTGERFEPVPDTASD